MIISVPISRASGQVMAPPSKSMAHRRILAAALAKGESVVSHLTPSEDILATIDALTALGARFVWEGDSLRVTGFDPAESRPTAPLPCRECGTTLRLMIPIALLTGVSVTLTGSKTLFSRPLGVYESLCQDRGFLWQKGEDFVTVEGRLTVGEYEVDAGVSSQFISGLAYALSTLEGESHIRLTGRVESRSYIDLTVLALQEAGVQIAWEGKNTLHIVGGTYQSKDTVVEGDWSNAAPYLALAALGDPVTVEGLLSDSLQGDRVGKPYFASLKEWHPVLSVKDCPDLAPMLMAVGACLHGVTLTDTARLRFKESDRGAVMAEELQKCGVPVTLTDNQIVVEGGHLTSPQETLKGHNDHRIVMALTILLSRVGGRMDDAESVNKSYPTFFIDMAGVGIECKDATVNP